MISVWNAPSIRQSRSEAEFSVKSAAEALSITPEYLSMIENGHKSPSQKLIAKMSDLYKVPITAFLQNEKNLVKA